MRIISLIFILFFSSIAFSEPKIEIIDKLKNINNLKFNFSQKINEKKEKGECSILYPKKILCIYEDIYNKILVSNGKSLVINSDKSNQYYIYKLEKTPLNIILDKNYLINKINQMNKLDELNNSYLIELKQEKNLITIFIDKTELVLTGWTTIDIYQNIVETKISNIRTNFPIDENIFDIRKYIN